MDKVEKIRQEIERLKEFNRSMADNAFNSNMRNFYDGEEDCCKQILSFLDTISEESDKSLEEKTCKGFEEEFRRFIKKEKEKELDKSLPYYGDYGIYRVARHLSEWGAEHLKK